MAAISNGESRLPTAKQDSLDANGFPIIERRNTHSELLNNHMDREDVEEDAHEVSTSSFLLLTPPYYLLLPTTYFFVCLL